MTAEPPSRDRPMLSARSLEKSFHSRGGGSVLAVDRISFDLGVGETLALVGESGSGKSTTASIVMRLLRPDRGQLIFEGVDITTALGGKLKAYHRRVQIVFQDPQGSLNPRQTIGEQIAMPMQVHGVGGPSEIEERVLGLLTAVGLSGERAAHFPHQFSGGERQRICIARALALGPQLVVADEVVSSLDVSTQAKILNLLLELQHQLRLSYLFVSHDLAVVERVAHRVAIMRQGRIVEIGTREAVFEDPRHGYSQSLLMAARRRRARVPAHWRPASSSGIEDGTSELVEVTPGHLVAMH